MHTDILFILTYASKILNTYLFSLWFLGGILEDVSVVMLQECTELDDNCLLVMNSLCIGLHHMQENTLQSES